MENKHKNLLTIDGLAAELQVSRRTIYSWLGDGTLAGLKIVKLKSAKSKGAIRPKSLVRFRRQDVNEWIQTKAT